MATTVAEEGNSYEVAKEKITKEDIPVDKLIKEYEKEMKEAAKNLNFERAAELRDLISELKNS